MFKALYLHSPFCKSKCSYCVYDSKVATLQNISKYYDVELPNVLNSSSFKKICEDNVFEELYCGGGTPTLGSAIQWKNLLDMLPLDKIKMLCTEGSPETITQDHISLWGEYKFKWVSLGVQSLDKDILKKNNRYFADPTYIKEIISEINLLNIISNIDVICGLNFKDERDISFFIKDLEKIMSFIQPISITVHVNMNIPKNKLKSIYIKLLPLLKRLEGNNSYSCVNHDLIFSPLDVFLNAEFRFMRSNKDFIFRQISAYPTKLVKNWITWKVSGSGIEKQSIERENISEIVFRDTAYRSTFLYRSEKKLPFF